MEPKFPLDVLLVNWGVSAKENTMMLLLAIGILAIALAIAWFALRFAQSIELPTM